MQFRKMSGKIIKNGKSVDIVHWIQDGNVNKSDEKDVTDRLKKK